jgi:hypothetical protein
MGKPSAPAAPDPKDTAAASTGTNVATAIANMGLNQVNQITPDGSLTYETIGYDTFTDPYTGQTYQIPKRQATQTLSEANQAIKNNSDQAGINLSGMAMDQSAALRDRLNSPFEFTNRDAETWAYDLASPRILEQQKQNEAALRTTLANKGIKEGSAAWNSEMARLTQGNSDQLNQLALTGRSQAYNEARDQYTLPVNTITALLSGSQVQNPNFVNTPQSQIPTTDVGGLINQDYQNRYNAYNSQMQQWNSVMGGLMGMGGKLISLSDKRAKKDIKKVGEVDGLGLYDFKYKGSDKKVTGLMAQDVERKKPDAVFTGRDGLKRVDYGKALGLMGA